MSLLKNKVAIITGASRGIGRAMALRFAGEGASVAFTDIKRDENMISLESELLAMGVQAKGYESDASSFQHCEATVNEIISDFGQVDALINNAGITRDNLLLRMTEQDWDLVMNINLKSVFNMTKQVVRPMMKARAGSIVNISSVVGVFGNAGQGNYSASKAGIIGFTKSMAKEFGSRNIRCNAIAPGFIATAMTDKLTEETKATFLANIPLNRLGSGDDVANAAVFLSSDLSTYISGQVLSVCGALNT
ncbi:MAG TPA: 3-oxoacyl-[acyl-carrier-protein] reductase [Saprospiraceae bacterium]|nr:3-oxoacyl-[acyl-carrier-protein] reductase [Saprospirales bacterium]HRQ30892.1 3-oxoacyl-[acyl-carrier-protein] reductase [Saprospiraceae bacterium]